MHIHLGALTLVFRRREDLPVFGLSMDWQDGCERPMLFLSLGRGEAVLAAESTWQAVDAMEEREEENAEALEYIIAGVRTGAFHFRQWLPDSASSATSPVATGPQWRPDGGDS